MKTRSLQISSRRESFRRPMLLDALLIFAAMVLLAATAAPAFSRQPGTPQPPQGLSVPNVKCVIGLDNIKPSTKGTLALLPGGLEFTTEHGKVDISTASIQDIFTGQQSRQDVTGPEGTLAKAAIPYGGGRIVSLFSHGVEVLTVEYVDSNGGFHGTIFVLAPGKATEMKGQLVAQGAKVTTHVDLAEPKEQK
jgi:hypothetical protein